MVSGNAQRPGDIVKSLVVKLLSFNTDMKEDVLADALTFTEKI